MDKNIIENITLGEKLRYFRKAKGYTQEQVAEMIDIDTKYLARLEKGLHNPTFKVIKKLAGVLDFDISKIDDVCPISPPDKYYTKAMQILNSANTAEERHLYYEALLHTQKCMKLNK